MEELRLMDWWHRCRIGIGCELEEAGAQLRMQSGPRLGTVAVTAWSSDSFGRSLLDRRSIEDRFNQQFQHRHWELTRAWRCGD